MARRRYGSGGVTKRADGRWEGRLWLADGSRRSIYARNREQCGATAGGALAAGLGDFRANGLLLGDYLRQWLEVAHPTATQDVRCLRDLPAPRRAPTRPGAGGQATRQLIQRTYADLLARGTLGDAAEGSAREQSPDSLVSSLGGPRHSGPPHRETLGLKWSDVDLVTGRLQVKRALQRQRGRGLVFVEPKSFRSRRLVCLSNLAI